MAGLLVIGDVVTGIVAICAEPIASGTGAPPMPRPRPRRSALAERTRTR